MKLKLFKQIILCASVMIFACCLSACLKNNVRITNYPAANTTTSGTGTTTTTAAPDTLPSFYNPAGLAIDAAGNLYVADYGNDLIRKITPAQIVTTLAGSGTQGTLNGTGIVASFNQPKGVAVDAAGNVYVADAGNNIIRKITSAGVVTTLAGSDSTGMADGPGITATFFAPAGVAVDATGNVFVADAGNNLIRMVTPAGFVSTPAGTNNGTVFSNPTGIAIDASSNLYVANNLANNILFLNSAKAVSVFAGSGQPGAGNGAAASATFYYPNSVALDVSGNVYVADGVNNLIRKITPAGLVSTFAGSGVAGSVDSVGTAASFNGPSGLAVDAAGNVYVSDTNNNLIRKITPAGVVTTFAGSGLAGARNGKALSHRAVTLKTGSVTTRANIWHKP